MPVHSQHLSPSKLNLHNSMLGSHLKRSRLLKGLQKTAMVYQVILIDLWQLVSEALTRDNKFWFSIFFL